MQSVRSAVLLMARPVHEYPPSTAQWIAAARARLVTAIVGVGPNVSVIDLREMLATFRGIAGAVTRGVTAVGALVLTSGLLILVGAVSATKFRRAYEVAILRTLGAGSGVLTALLAVEYALLGAVAGTIGAAGSMLLSWAVATRVLDLPWEPAPWLAAAGCPSPLSAG